MQPSTNASEGSVPCLDIFFILFSGLVHGETPDDIIIDGDYTEWPADSLMGSDANVSTSAHGTQPPLPGMGRYGLEINHGRRRPLRLPQHLRRRFGPRTRLGFCSHASFAADHGFVIEDDTYYQHISYDGSSWTDQTTEVGLYAGWADNKPRK